MFLLARSLAERGLRVSHIVAHGADVPRWHDGVRLVHLRPPCQTSGPGGLIRRVSEALAAADAHVYLQRSPGVATALVGAFARIHRRHFIYSTSSSLDLVHRAPQALVEAVGFRLGLSLATAVVVQTQEQATEAIGDTRVVRIPSLCEPTPRPSLQTVRDLFLWVGRPASYKNPQAFVDLARAVPDAQFVMVGVDLHSLDAGSPTSATPTPPIPANLNLLGPLPQAEISLLYERAVAVVNTSDFEGFPNVLLEGWAHGALALALRIDPDAVIRRHNLGTVADGSPATLAAAAARMWEERDRCQAQRDAAIRYVAAHHRPETVAAEWAVLIARFIGASKRSTNAPVDYESAGRSNTNSFIPARVIRRVRRNPRER